MESGGGIIVLGIFLATIVIAKVGMAYLRKVKVETGYNPTGFLNSLLIIGVFVFLVFGEYMVIDMGNTFGYVITIGGILTCIFGLVLRNRVLIDIKKIVLLTFSQVLAPMLTLLGILCKNIIVRCKMRSR